MSTEKNYDVHIFMHPTDEIGSNGFNIKKRKSLSDEEKREFEMQVTTGKVNQMGLEKSYFENYSRDEEEPAEEGFNKNRGNKFRGDKRGKNNRRDHRDNRRKFDDRNEKK